MVEQLCQTSGHINQIVRSQSNGRCHYRSLNLAILSGLPTLTQLFTAHLEDLGYGSDPTAPICLILDAPHSFAWQELARSQPHPPDARRIVATSSQCPEYLEDLWDMGLDGLVADGHNAHALETTLAHVSQGVSYRVCATHPTCLTRRERQVLRLLADGYSPKNIAAYLSLAHQSVKNTVATVYAKLGLANQREAMRYYWGIGSHASQGIETPPVQCHNQYA